MDFFIIILDVVLVEVVDFFGVDWLGGVGFGVVDCVGFCCG